MQPEDKNKESCSREKLWTAPFITLMGMNFGMALPFYLLMVVMTDFSMSTYDVSYAVGAISVSAFVLAALLARFLFGRYIDKWGIVKALFIGLLLNFVSIASYVVPMPFWLLISMRIIQGIGFALGSSAAASAAAILPPADRRAEGIGYFSMMQALATGIGPFVAVMLVNITGSYFPLFLFTAIISAVSLACIPLVKLPEKQNKSTAGTVSDTGSAPRDINRFVHTTVLLFTPAIFLIYLGYSGIVTFVVPFANEAELEEAVSLYFVLYAAIILLTRPSIGRHMDRHGEHPLIYISIGSIIIGLIVLGLAKNGLMLLASAVLAGFGIGATQSIIQAIIARDIPQHELGRANSTFFMSMDLGAGLGPMCIGALVPVLGFSLCYIVLACASILAIVLYHVLARSRAENT